MLLCLQRLSFSFLTAAIFPSEEVKTGRNISRELVYLLVNKFGIDPCSLSQIDNVTALIGHPD